MQQPAPFKPQVGHVLVVLVCNGKARQNGIAVMAVVIHDIFSIGMVMPNVSGQKFMLWFSWPVFMARFMFDVQSLNLLQKNDVCI